MVTTVTTIVAQKTPVDFQSFDYSTAADELEEILLTHIQWTDRLSKDIFRWGSELATLISLNNSQQMETLQGQVAAEVDRLRMTILLDTITRHPLTEDPRLDSNGETWDGPAWLAREQARRQFSHIQDGNQGLTAISHLFASTILDWVRRYPTLPINVTSITGHSLEGTALVATQQSSALTTQNNDSAPLPFHVLTTLPAEFAVAYFNKLEQQAMVRRNEIAEQQSLQRFRKATQTIIESRDVQHAREMEALRQEVVAEHTAITAKITAAKEAIVAQEALLAAKEKQFEKTLQGEWKEKEELRKMNAANISQLQAVQQQNAALRTDLHNAKASKGSRCLIQ